MSADRATGRAKRKPRKDGALNRAVVPGGKYALMDKREAWMREAADLYIKAVEIEGIPNSYAMRHGLVYMTRELLKAAWDNALGVSAPTSGINSARESHRSDYWVTKFAEDNKLMTAGRNNYMLTADYCAKLGLTELWETFTGRQDAADLAQYGTERKGQWAAIQTNLHDHDLFDLAYVDDYAKAFDMDTHNAALTTQKIMQWCKSGFCYRVARGLYRVAKWDVFEGAPTKQIEFSNWMYEFIRHQADLQYRDPDLTFSVNRVMEVFADAHYNEYAKERPFLRNDSSYMSQRMSKCSHNTGVEPGEIPADALFLHHGRNRFQINPMVIHRWFRFDLRNDVHTLALKVAEFMVNKTGWLEAFWIIEQDIEHIISGHGSSARKIIRHLLDRGFIEQDGDANADFFKGADIYRPDWYRPAPLYVASPPAFDHFGVEFGQPSVSEDRHGVPRRIRVPWGDDPDYLEAISHIARGYEKAKELKNGN